MIVTFFAWLGYVVGTVLREFINHGSQGMRFASEAASYLVIVTLLTYSAMIYLACRHGALSRRTRHERATREQLARTGGPCAPSLTVLVPSFREQASVIRQTLLSAALQEYPNLRVILLVDDPPAPTDREHQAMLAAALAQPTAIADLLAPPADAARRSLAGFETRLLNNPKVSYSEIGRLVTAYEGAAGGLERLAADEPSSNHVDRFVADHVIRRLAHDLTITAQALRHSRDDFTEFSVERVRDLYRRLVSIFHVEVEAFERKLFASLSHEPNKAMNLNSYIGLMGRSFAIDHRETGAQLRELAPGGDLVAPSMGSRDELIVPDSDFVLTLDADSVLLPEYCLRLVHFLEQPVNERVAVAQTPYCAFPGATSRLERIAGATTDLQHLVHQGMSFFGATFWVGANAVLRKEALDDVMTVDIEGNAEIRRYIRDRTVIEDTESSIDLIAGVGRCSTTRSA